MEITELKVEQLTPYENNAKIHTEEQIKAICDSIEYSGFNDPIAVDENNVIIEGHGRLEAAKRLGMETVPCIVLKNLSDAQKKAYILAHNKLTMSTGFEFDKLKSELSKLKELEFEDFSILGFAEYEINEMFADVDYESLLEDLYKTPAGNTKKSKTKHYCCPKCKHEWDA